MQTGRRLRLVVSTILTLIFPLPAMSQAKPDNTESIRLAEPIWSVFDDADNPHAISFDASGKRLSRGSMKSVAVYDVEDGTLIARIGAGSGFRTFSSSNLSADGNSVHLVVVPDGQDQFFETRGLNGAPPPTAFTNKISLFPNNNVPFQSTDHSRNIHFFGVDYQKAHIVYPDRDEPLVLDSNFGGATGVPLTSGNIALVQSDGLAIMDPSGTEITRIPGGDMGYSPKPVVTSNDDQLVAVAGVYNEDIEEVIRVFDLDAEQVAYDLEIPDLDRQYIADLAFSGTSVVVAFVDFSDQKENLLRVYRLTHAQRPEQLATVNLGNDGALAKLSPDATALAVTWSSGRLEVFSLISAPVDMQDNPTTGAEVTPRLVAGLGHPEQISDVALSADGRLLATSGNNGLVWLWDMQSNRAINGMQLANGYSKLLFSNDGQYLYAKVSNHFYQFETKTGRLTHKLDDIGSMQVLFMKNDPDYGFVSCYPYGCSLYNGQVGAWPELIPTPLRAVSGAQLCGKKIVLRKTDNDNTQLALLSLDQKTEEQLISIGFPVSKVACSDGGGLFLGTENGELVKVSPNGDILMRTKLGDHEIRSITPVGDSEILVAMNGVGYVGAPDNPAQLFLLSSFDFSILTQAEFPQGQDGTSAYVTKIALSQDHKIAVTATQSSLASAGKIIRWTLPNLIPEAGPKTTMRAPQNVQFSPDGKTLAVTFPDSTALWSLETGQVKSQRSHNFGGRVVLTNKGISSVGPIGSLSHQFNNDFDQGPLSVHVPALGRGMDQEIALRIGQNDSADLMTSDGTLIGAVSLSGISPVAAVASPEMNALVATGYDSKALLWHASTGKSQLLDARLVGQMGVGFTPDGSMVALAERTGSVSLWKTQTGELLANLYSTKDGGWAVVSPEGRYDAADPGNVPGLSWVLPDAPYTPEPVEIYYLDYYEPRLLSRKIFAEAFPPVPSPSERNRVTPTVRFAKLKPTGIDADEIQRVSIELEITQRYRNAQESGLGAVKLFRDAQLVATSELASFGGSETLTVHFEGIRLPPDQSEISFSAYAFNDDGIKSETATQLYEQTDYDTVSQRRAYVIAVGVNAYDNPSWNLSYAASDAEANALLISQGLEASGDFETVYNLALISREGSQKRHARRDIIEAVLTKIAGERLPDNLPPDVIEIANKFPPARPQDLVYLALAGHGLAASDGQFHFFPQEFGAGANSRVVDENALKGSLNSDRLADILLQIDARDMLLVIDACNSAASVEGGGFRPGPMGSRGLGQLAYDKSMRVLAASQSESVALESDRLLHGALSYVMLREGLEAENADRARKDGATSFSELFTFTTERVPILYDELRKGSFTPMTRGSVSLVEQDNTDPPEVQRPALFDFRGADNSKIYLKASQQ